MYTKGEWRIIEGDNNFIVTNERGFTLFKTPTCTELDKANANLIAASPRMAEALGTIKRTAESSGDLYYLQNALKIIAYQARQALAEVEGKGS